MCSECNVGLCIVPCFKTYHDQFDFWTMDFFKVVMAYMTIKNKRVVLITEYVRNILAEKFLYRKNTWE